MPRIEMKFITLKLKYGKRITINIDEISNFDDDFFDGIFLLKRKDGLLISVCESEYNKLMRFLGQDIKICSQEGCNLEATCNGKCGAHCECPA